MEKIIQITLGIMVVLGVVFSLKPAVNRVAEESPETLEVFLFPVGILVLILGYYFFNSLKY